MRHSKRQIEKLRGSLRADESDGHGYYRQRLEWEMTKAFWHLLDSPQSPLLINAAGKVQKQLFMGARYSLS